MDPPNDDYSFDFFEDEPPVAGQGLRGRVRQRGSRSRAASQGPPRQVAPLLRLLGLVSVVVFLLLVFALLVNSCAAQSRHDAYANYMGQVNAIALASSADGAHAVSALTTQGLSVPQMVQKLRSLAAAERQNVQAAQSLGAPGRLRGENANLIEALELRVLGLDGLASEFASAGAAKAPASTEALALSRQASRLLASDIIWDDLFLKPAATQLARDGVGGVNVPESHFLSDPNLIVTPKAMSLVVQRIVVGATPKGTPAGLHGTQLVSVEALSKGANGTPQLLHTGSLNTVTTSSTLVFRVTIFDGGNFQEVQIPVQLTIGRPQAQGGPITKTATVQLIDPGTNATVVFSDLGQVPFAAQTTVTVDVARVPGETNISDNSAQYNVIFSLPG